MSIKELGFDEVKRRAEKFRDIAKEFSLYQEFDIGEDVEKFLETNPLAPIIGTICDQQITAEDAWTFPYWLSKKFKGKDFTAELIIELGKDKIKELLRDFMKNKWTLSMRENDRQQYLENVSGYIIDTCCFIVKEPHFIF